MKRFLCIMVIILLAFLIVLQAGGLQNPVKAETSNTWQEIGHPNPIYMTDFEIDPSNPNHMMITSFLGPDKYSLDGGVTWNDLWLERKPWENMLSTKVYCINGIWYFNSWGIIWKTTDFSQFDKIAEFTDTSIDSFWTDGNNFFIGLRAGLDSENRCLYKSVDQGKTWENLSTSVREGVGKDYPYYLGVPNLTFFPKGTVRASESLLFVSVNGTDLLVSLDEGKTFQKAPHLCMPQRIGNTLLADDWNTGKFLYQSFDGINWQIINKNFDYSHRSYFAYDLANETIYFCDSEKGVFYSQDGGRNWIKYYSGNLNFIGGFARIKVYNSTLYLVLNDSLYTNSLIAKKVIIILLQIGNNTFTVNGETKTLDSPPVIKNGRTLLPIRAVIEALGGFVGWDASTKKVTVTLSSNTIELWIGKNTASVNGISKPIDSTNPKVVPEIINSRTMLPLRFVTENLGCDVQWDGATQTITVIYTGGG